MNKLKNNLPNLVTITRIISSLLGSIFLVTGNIPLSITCYTYGAISDAIDGLLARKLNAITSLGKKLDPISDKIYALSLLIPGIIMGNIFMIITLLLETTISIINTYSEYKYKNTHTEQTGRKKTIILFPTLILGLIAAKNPMYYLAYLPSMYLTTNMQVKSIMAYSKQLENNKNNNQNKTTSVKNNNQLKEITYSKEIINNTKLTNNKVKKLIKRKDYNDRH